MDTVVCVYCGKTLPKNEATFCEDAGYYACQDCACDNAHRGYNSYLCDCCYDDLFG